MPEDPRKNIGRICPFSFFFRLFLLLFQSSFRRNRVTRKSRDHADACQRYRGYVCLISDIIRLTFPPMPAYRIHDVIPY